MTTAALDRALTSKHVPTVAALVSLALGLVFIFVWAPHPWGWFGIDQYHQIAVDLSHGAPFPTLDVPWGYGYFLAAFYRLFGPTPAPALVAQALLNALIPVLVYRVAAREFDVRVAAVAAVLVSVLSFNTIYASTEASDAVCTFLFMLMLWAFVEGRRTGRWPWFASTGVLLGLAAQFRPNLLLLPIVLAAFHVMTRRLAWRHVRDAALVVVMAVLMVVPWTWRNYRLTGEIIPTSTHGGVQLWYGSLETGAFLTSRAHNPRRLFETPSFDYTSLVGQSVLFDVSMTCAPAVPDAVELVYRTDDNPTPRRVSLVESDRHWAGAVPAPGRPSRLYYWLEARWPVTSVDPPIRTSPPGGAADPFVYFISPDHRSDLDVDDALWDVFDVVRVLRHIAWQEPVRLPLRLDRDHDGRIDEADLRNLLRLMLVDMDRGEPSIDRLASVRVAASNVRAVFVDGSELVVPLEWSGFVTDLQLSDGVASTLLSVRRRVAAPEPAPKVPLSIACLAPGEVAINTPFYRVQPHEMRRYTALALDNIARGPVAYAASVLYRSVRLFVIMGSEDQGTAHQFAHSRLVYLVGTVVSSTFFLLFLAGRVDRLAPWIRRPAAAGARRLHSRHHRVRAGQHAVHDHRAAGHHDVRGGLGGRDAGSPRRPARAAHGEIGKGAACSLNVGIDGSRRGCWPSRPSPCTRRGFRYAPVYLTHDEVKFALQAQSIAETGRDLNGRWFPVYFSEPEFPAGRDPLVIYATAAVLQFLPLSETAVRLPIALLSVLTVLLILLLARRVFDNDGLALAAAAMFALSPGAFLHGRIGISVLYPIPFVMLWAIGLDRYRRDRRRLTLMGAGAALVLAGYGYLGGMVMMPVYVALTAVWMLMPPPPGSRLPVPDSRLPIFALRWLLLGIAVALIPLFAWQVAHPERFGELMGAYRVGGAADPEASRVAGLLSFEGARLRLGQWWSYFNPDYLFISGDTSMTDSTRGAGLFPLAFAVLLPIGLPRLWRAGALGRLIVLGFLTAPLAAVMTGTLDLNRYRALLVLPFGVLTAAAGLEAMWRAPWRGWRWLAVLLLATIPYQFWGVYADYMGPYRTATSTWFGRNVRGAVVAVLAQAGEGEAVFLSSHVPYADAYWQFYAHAMRKPERVHRFAVVDAAAFDPVAAPAGAWVVCPVEERLGSVLRASADWRETLVAAEPDGTPSFVVFHKHAGD